MAERRIHQRFDFEDKCLVRHAQIVGTVRDLSLGGLSCSCWSSSPGVCASQERKKVDIFCTENKMWVRDLSLAIIDTENIPGEFLDHFWVRRCRARFEELREEQSLQLENLILDYATQ